MNSLFKKASRLIFFQCNISDVEGADSGSTYLFLGHPTEMWAHNMTFSNANASFVGESTNDWSGSSVSSAGDVNGDSFSSLPTPFMVIKIELLPALVMPSEGHSCVLLTHCQICTDDYCLDTTSDKLYILT